MREILVTLERGGERTLQGQLRELLVNAILEGHLKPGDRLPSTRRLADQLQVARNTVVLVFQSLAEDGYLRTAERSGYFVAPTVLEMGVHAGATPPSPPVDAGDPIDWPARLTMRPTTQRNIAKPTGWRDLPYPFIYGQPDAGLFPITDWRDCVHKAMGKRWLDAWTQDTQGHDDPMLIDQIRTRILPRRGILVGEEQIMVTLGAQQSLYIAAALLVGRESRVGMEDPGYPDARNIFELHAGATTPLAVDGEGLVPDGQLCGLDVVYTTPSHQLPTTVTMPTARRRALLEAAEREDFVVIEDDYELETNYVGKPLPALKSIDGSGRVIYVGSFSKTLFPGLRLGFVVAPASLIAEMRALRRLMVRHAPVNNQRTTAFFLSLGHYDVFVRRLNRAYRARWAAMGSALSRHLPNAQVAPGLGGSSYWVRLGDGVDAERVARTALEDGVLIEPGSVYFARGAPADAVRLGFSSIDHEAIEPGLLRLGEAIRHVNEM